MVNVEFSQVTADNALAAAHQIRQLTERGERPIVDPHTKTNKNTDVIKIYTKTINSSRGQ